MGEARAKALKLYFLKFGCGSFPCVLGFLGYYRGEKKGLQILLSYSQAGTGRKAKQGQEQISRIHVPTFFLGSVHMRYGWTS